MTRIFLLLTSLLVYTTLTEAQVSNLRIAVGGGFTAAESNAHTQLGGLGYNAEVSYRHHFKRHVAPDMGYIEYTPYYIRPSAGILSHSINKFKYEGKESEAIEGSTSGTYIYGAFSFGMAFPLHSNKWSLSGDAGLGYFYGQKHSYTIGGNKMDAFAGEGAWERGSLGTILGIEAYLREKRVFFRLDMIIPNFKGYRVGDTGYKFKPSTYTIKIGYSF